MKVLLHGCCADCTLKFLESVKENQEIKELAVYYYNPNIHPRSEYVSRLEAMQKICKESGTKLIIPDWSPREYFKVVRAREGRCPKCWELRVGRAADYAREKGYGAVATTLVTSQYQNSEIIRKIAVDICRKAGVEFFEPKHVCCELKTKGFYKQFFCGCVYSLQERYEEKYKEEEELIQKEKRRDRE